MHPITIQRAGPMHIEASQTLDGVTLTFGDGVWVNNYLIQPDDAIEFSTHLQEAAIQCRAMRAQP